ncbi:hypothetical protein MEO39_26700 [Dolichospermum sp. ST_sed2]|nr:hypothetical protein [Dolichospermum sp. ST_sed2]
MPHLDEHSKPYQKEVFRYVFFGFFIVVLILNFVVYYAALNAVNRNVRQSLKEIAENVAENVSYLNLEKIVSNNQQQSLEFTEIEQYFQQVMTGNPLIDEIYTLRPTEDSNTMTFIVAGKESKDLDNDNYIDDSELRPEIGEKFDVTNLPDLKNGLIEPSADREVNADKWG